MKEALGVLPISFWIVIAIMVGGFVKASRQMRDGTGIPMMLVLVTVAAWYVGDVLYNDYLHYHYKIFSARILDAAWFEVALFLLVFIFGTAGVHRWFNKRYLDQPSGVVHLFKQGTGQAAIQSQLKRLFGVCVGIWCVLGVLATIRLQGEALHYFFPFWGYKAQPWGRERMGSGFDAVLSAAFYFQLLVAGIFGVVAALATDNKVRFMAVFFCFMTWPYFILDRTRNTMLAAVIPGMLSWGLLRVRGGLLKKAVVLGGFFIIVNAWMAFVIANRSDMTMSQAIRTKGFSLENKEKAHHEGLNMYEELCWINAYMADGVYNPTFGARYFADAVNFVPRSIWHGKPTIGLDYAKVRGQGGDDAGEGGVNATVSTGVVGQGVVSFGRILGPAAAAWLMSLWVACLARLDLNIHRLGYLPLYGTALILTFNLGRDISLLTLYPFLFGWATVWWLGRNRPVSRPVTSPARVSTVPAGAKPKGFVQGRTVWPRAVRRPMTRVEQIVRRGRSGPGFRR